MYWSHTVGTVGVSINTVSVSINTVGTVSVSINYIRWQSSRGTVRGAWQRARGGRGGRAQPAHRALPRARAIIGASGTRLFAIGGKNARAVAQSAILTGCESRLAEWVEVCGCVSRESFFSDFLFFTRNTHTHFLHTVSSD